MANCEACGSVLILAGFGFRVGAAESLDTITLFSSCGFWGVDVVDYIALAGSPVAH